MVSIAIQDLVSLTRFHFFVFVFISVPWETDLRKLWCNLCQRMLCLCALPGVRMCVSNGEMRFCVYSGELETCIDV